MRCKKRIVIGAVAAPFMGALVVLAVSSPEGGADVELARGVVSNGGTSLAVAGEYELSGVVGQPGTAVLAAGDFTLTGGFMLPAMLGDLTGDGFVGPDDAAQMPACLFGPFSPSDASCAGLDTDGDEDVDLQDAALFQANYLR